MYMAKGKTTTGKTITGTAATAEDCLKGMQSAATSEGELLTRIVIVGIVGGSSFKVRKPRAAVAAAPAVPAKPPVASPRR